MTDEKDVLFEHRLRNAFHAVSLPPAPDGLRAALEDLPRLSTSPTRAVPRWAATGALAAGLAVVAFVAWAAIFGQGGVGPGVAPTPTPSVSPSPSPTPSPTSSLVTVYPVEQLVAMRADGSIDGESVDVVGWFSDARFFTDTSGVPFDPCPSPRSALELTCQELRQGVTQNEALIGSYVEGGWVPNVEAGAVLHPYWPRSLQGNPQVTTLFSIAPPDPGTPMRPIFVMLNGHFDDAQAADCPADAAPPCADRFVVDDVISVDDPFAVVSPAPSGSPFPFDSPPPPPVWMANCTKPRSQEPPEPGDPVDPGLSSQGWMRKSDVPFEYFGSEMAAEMVYVGIVEGDFPLGIWIEAPAGSGQRYRWWGTSTCVSDANGIWYSWLPGTTYRVYQDGHRVDGGDPFDPMPTATPAP